MIVPAPVKHIKMKVKVLQRFRDKHDKVTRYEVGTEHVFDDERANDLITRGLAEAVVEQPNEDVDAKGDEVITEAKEPGMKVVKTTEKEPEKEPAAKEPTAKEPAAKEPATKEPAAKEPAAKEPAAKGPAAKEPATKEPEQETKKPEVKESETKGS